MGCVKFSSVEVPAEANYKECMMQILGDKCQSCLTVKWCTNFQHRNFNIQKAAQSKKASIVSILEIVDHIVHFWPLNKCQPKKLRQQTNPGNAEGLKFLNSWVGRSLVSQVGVKIFQINQKQYQVNTLKLILKHFQQTIDTS